jgi:hypothetical protein
LSCGVEFDENGVVTMPEEKSEKESGREGAAADRTARPRRLLWVVLALALLFVLVLGGVGSSPYWAPFLMPLFPWAAKSAVSPARFAALAVSERAFETRTNRDLADLKSRVETAAKRLDALLAGVNLSHENAAQIAALKERLEKSLGAAASSAKSGAPGGAGALAASAAVEGLGKSLAALESKWAEKAAEEHVAIQRIKRDLRRLNAVTASLADRVPQLAAKLRARRRAQQSEAGLFLALLDMREAVDAGRPFREAYEGFLARVRKRPQVADAAAPLAAAAREGVPTLAALAQRLSRLASSTAPPAQPKGSSWAARLAAHLRSLVRIRKAGTAAAPAFHKAVAEAEHDLSHGDIESAVAALEPLPSAPAVKSWIAAAEARFRAEGALTRLRDLLISDIDAGLPASPAAPASSSPQGANPRKPG